MLYQPNGTPVPEPTREQLSSAVKMLIYAVRDGTGAGPLLIEEFGSLPADAREPVALALMSLAGMAVSETVLWCDMLRDFLARADEVMINKATVYGEWHVSEPRTEAETAADEAREMRLNAIADAHDLVSIWSYGEDVDMAAPHPYPTTTTVVHETISGVAPGGMRVWGGDGGRFTVPILGNRWLDLWIAADAAIQQSNDLHHRFIEAFDPNPTRPGELHLFCRS